MASQSKCLNWRPRAPRAVPNRGLASPTPHQSVKTFIQAGPEPPPKSTIFRPFAKLPLRSLCDSNAAPESQKPLEWPPTADPRAALHHQCSPDVALEFLSPQESPQCDPTAAPKLHNLPKWPPRAAPKSGIASLTLHQSFKTVLNGGQRPPRAAPKRGLASPTPHQNPLLSFLEAFAAPSRRQCLLLE